MTTLHPAREGMKVGQRVMAGFSGPPASNMTPRLGVITGEFRYGAYPVQFQPCGSHWHCHHVVAYGDANGWTDEEYRVEREKSYCIEQAVSVERERQERYPDKPFSMYRPDSLRNPEPVYPGLARGTLTAS